MTAEKFGLSWDDAPEWADILIRDINDEPVYLWVAGEFEGPGEHRVAIAGGGGAYLFHHNTCTFTIGRHNWELLDTRPASHYKHPHDAVIRAWLDGADVEWSTSPAGYWHGVTNVQDSLGIPSFSKRKLWRVAAPKRKTLEDAVKQAQAELDAYLAEE